MENNYIVYAAFDVDGVCLYVGEGKEDRYKHITSGISHVYEANRYHFEGKKVNVEILHSGLTKRECVRIEKVEINKRRPAWNKAAFSNPQATALKSHGKKMLLDAYRNNSKRHQNKEKYLIITRDLCACLNVDGEAIIMRGQNWCSIELPTGFMSHMKDDTGKYYDLLKEVFHVEGAGRNYLVRLKEWNKKFAEKITEGNEDEF